MKEEKVIILIHKRLLGTISVEENTTLTAWIAAAPERLALVEETELAWELSQSKVSAFVPDLDRALHRFQDRLTTEAAPEAEIHSLPIRRQWLKIASIAAALAGVFLVWNQFFAPSADWQIAQTGAGEQQMIQLVDGTQVWLNEGSQLSYPQKFGKTRLVQLKGEAFFDVAKDAQHPFVIEADGAEIDVLGTSFNVRSYAEEEKIVVAVRSGKVRFQPDRSSQNWTLEATDKITFDKARKRYHQEVDDTANDWSWHSQQLQFKKTRLKSVIDALERHYHLTIKLSNKDLYDCRFYTGSFKNAKVEDILASLELAFGLKLEQINSQSYRLNGGTCQ